MSRPDFNSITLVHDLIDMTRRGAPMPIAPVDLSSGFEDPSIACFSGDLSPGWETGAALFPAPPFLAWKRTEDGQILKADPDTLDIPALRTLAHLAGSLTDITPFGYAAQDMDPEISSAMRAYYFRSCTVIGWADSAQAALLLSQLAYEEDDGSVAYESFTPAGLLGAAYANLPLSNHARLEHVTQLEEDLRAHVVLLNGEISHEVVFGGMPELPTP